MRRAKLAGALTLAAALALGACGSSGDGASTDTTAADSAAAGDGCPVDPIDIVVSVNQWGDIVTQLAGDCGNVTTIIDGGNVDPHDFEPSPADTAAFEGAELVVVNGLDYDHWAEHALEDLAEGAAVVNAGEVVGLEEGDNPHIWYGPTYVEQVSAAVTSELETLLPDAASYLDAQAESWQSDWSAVLEEIDLVSTTATGVTYGATESVFAYMGDALGMENGTPDGYQRAAANETDPSPADINAFEEALRDGELTVLIYNSQTEGAVPEQIRQVASDAGIPVVEVTESVPADAAGFDAWQIAQLQALAAALGG